MGVQTTVCGLGYTLDEPEMRVIASQTCRRERRAQTSRAADPYPWVAFGFPSGDSHVPQPRWETLPLLPGCCRLWLPPTAGGSGDGTANTAPFSCGEKGL